MNRLLLVDLDKDYNGQNRGWQFDWDNGYRE